MDKGTLTRTVALAIALVNQVLVSVFGWDPFPVNEELAGTIIDLAYELFSIVLTTITAIVAWFRNNYVTERGKQQKKVIEDAGVK